VNTQAQWSAGRPKIFYLIMM